jgi:tetratricopeptide (TPR) repeat protein
VIPILLALAAAQTPAAPPPAASPAETSAETRYRTCAALVRTEPQRAADSASAWQRSGGGFLARQCLGLAYVQLEMWASAATAFEQAAQEAGQDARRPDLLVQAGNAWLAVDEAGNAIRAFDAALTDTQLTDPMRGEIHLDRARARIALDEAAAARADVDRALELVPLDAFAWYMSAALARRENNLARAGTDIARAMQLAPDNPDIMLLAGTLAGLAGNMAEAERLYRRVSESAPTTEAGRAAAASLATLREVEVPAPAVPAPTAAPAQSPTTAPAPATTPPQPQSR